MLRGVHGRTPASLFALWQWQLDQPLCDHIGRSAARVLAELISRRVEIEPVLRAVLRALPVRQAVLFLESCVACAVGLTPERQRDKRDARKALGRLRAKAAAQASALAETLGEMRKSAELHDIDAYPLTAVSLVALLLRAGEDNALFRQWVDAPVFALLRRFNGRYWPDLPLALNAMAFDLKLHLDRFNDSDDAEAIAPSGKGGAAGLARVVLTLMRGEPDPAEDDSLATVSWRPVELTDAELAGLLTVLLLRPEFKPVDPDNVKAARQRHGK